MRLAIKQHPWSSLGLMECTELSEVVLRPLVALGKSDLIDKLGVAVLPSMPFRADIVRSFDRVFRFLPEPCGASARDPRTPPSTRRSAALRQATETDT